LQRTEQVFALVNDFLQDLASAGSAGEVPANLLPASIHSLVELERWLMPVRHRGPAANKRISRRKAPH
jgi:hypothetical protein